GSRRGTVGKGQTGRKTIVARTSVCIGDSNFEFVSSFEFRISNFFPLRLTIIHPCIGRKPGQKYIRTWQMEALPAATLAGLTPKGVDVRFYDDRMEEIPFNEPADLVAISVETYTAKRAYQIATEYRKRHVPVVMGGFHATLCPDEA